MLTSEKKVVKKDVFLDTLVLLNFNFGYVVFYEMPQQPVGHFTLIMPTGCWLFFVKFSFIFDKRLTVTWAPHPYYVD
jgi:hypothetical protein